MSLRRQTNPLQYSVVKTMDYGKDVHIRWKPTLKERMKKGYLEKTTELKPEQVGAHAHIHMETQGTLIPKTMLKKNKAGKFIFPDLKIHYKVIVIKTVWYRQKTNRIEYRAQK